MKLNEKLIIKWNGLNSNERNYVKFNLKKQCDCIRVVKENDVYNLIISKIEPGIYQFSQFESAQKIGVLRGRFNNYVKNDDVKKLYNYTYVPLVAEHDQSIEENETHYIFVSVINLHDNAEIISDVRFIISGEKVFNNIKNDVIKDCEQEFKEYCTFNTLSKYTRPTLIKILEKHKLNEYMFTYSAFCILQAQVDNLILKTYCKLSRKFK